MAHLTTTEVLNELRNVGATETELAAFEENEITGACLSQLTLQDLRNEMGIKSLSRRKSLFKMINTISGESPASSSLEEPLFKDPRLSVENGVISPPPSPRDLSGMFSSFIRIGLTC